MESRLLKNKLKNLSILLISCILLCSCKDIKKPKYDRCVLIIEDSIVIEGRTYVAGFGSCFPRNQPGKAGYEIPLHSTEEQKGMIGYHCGSTPHLANIFKYVEEVEEACKD